MKRKYLLIITAVLLALLLAACGSSSEAPEQDGSHDSGQEQTETTETTEESDAEPAEAENEVHPYAWLGYQDIPECDYLDILATNHYYRESEEYIKGLSYVSKHINAVDGINTYKDEDGSKTYSIDGKVTVVNEDAKYYMEQDATSLAESAVDNMETARKEGTNLYGREFQGTGSEAIPIYSEQTGDKNEYEYYEYSYPEFEKDEGNKETERVYLKDGDVYAIYQYIKWGETEVESTEVMKKMSGDIPDGLFKLPDLSGYEKMD
ncbi:MAG: hypothetical protein IJH41_03485 [Eubacterium sp.]|nr:hypothetical protein [Eubacterium sp.]